MEAPMFMMCDVRTCHKPAVWVQQGRKLTLWLCDDCCKINPRAWKRLHRHRNRQGWKLCHRAWFPPPRITYAYPEACPTIYNTPEPSDRLVELMNPWPPPTLAMKGTA